MSNRPSEITSNTITARFENGTLHLVRSTDMVLRTKARNLKHCYDLLYGGDLSKEDFLNVMDQIRSSDLPDGDDLQPRLIFCNLCGQHFSLKVCGGQTDQIRSMTQFDEVCKDLLEQRIITDEDVVALKEEIAHRIPNFPAEKQEMQEDNGLPEGFGNMPASARQALADLLGVRNIGGIRVIELGRRRPGM